MADQFDNTARSSYPDAEIDDPLAELARIIGYERPSEVAPKADEVPESSEFDLEAELMRELDVPLAPSVDDLDRIEADEALDVLMADGGFDHEFEQSFPIADLNAAELNAGDDVRIEEPLDDAPELDGADFMSLDGRSSGALLKAIETEFPVDQAPDLSWNDLSSDDLDDDGGAWMRMPDTDEVAAGELSNEPEDFTADLEQGFEPIPDLEELSAPTNAVVAQAPYESDHAGDDVLADMFRYERPLAPQGVPASSFGSDVTENAEPKSEPGEAPLDFEDYLSAELDVFGQEVTIAQSSIDMEPVAPSALDADETDSDVEIALDALNDSSLDEDVTVFDDAAEELLAAINGDVDHIGRPVPAHQRSPDAVGEWSLDSIEEGVAEELDVELGDMFGLPDRAAEPVAAAADVSDELEIDLEQVLADSFDGFDDDWAEPLEVDEDIRQSKPVVQADDWLPSTPAVVPSAPRDEMAEAFFDFVPHDDDTQPDLASAKSAGVHSSAGVAREPDQGDWLDGFETSDKLLEQGNSASASSGYYFDAELISDSDETVEMVGDIDVPELEHDDPQLFDQEYETEIEREFADIVEHNEQIADDGPTEVVAAALASAEGWSRGATTARGYEVSDDYIALERELRAGVDHAAVAAATTGYAGEGMVGDLDGANGMATAHGGNQGTARGPVLAIAVLGLALIAGIGALGWSMFSGDETTADGGPRIIRADTEPVKVLPENPGGVTVPNQDKAVYDRVAGGNGATAGQPALVNSAEEPVDVVQRTLDPEFLPLEGRADFNGKSEERLSADGTADEPTENAASAPVVSPRKVRTMIVKPDGSIVAREVTEPEAAVSADTSQTIASALPESAASSDTAQSLEPTQQASAETVAPAQDQAEGTDIAATEGTVAPVRIVKTQPIRPVSNAPVPEGRPADQPVNVVGTVSQGGQVGAAPAATSAPTTAAPATPAAPEPVAVASAPAAAAPVSNPGGYYMQIASQPTAEGAQSSWRTLSSRYSSVLGGLGVDIQRADIPGKGVFHRVRVAAGSRDQANALCTRYKAAGGSCFVSR